jgi:hypothetical protein
MNNVRYHAKGETLFVGILSQMLYVIMVVLSALRMVWVDFMYAFLLMTLVGAV